MLHKEIIDEQLKKALHLQHEGQYDEALLLYYSIKQSMPTNLDSIYQLGVISNIKKNYQLAVDLFSEAIVIDPSNPLYYFNCGIAYEGLNQLESAIKCYDTVISFNSNYADVHYNRGVCFQRLKKLESAIDCYDKVIFLNSDHVNAYFNRGVAFQELRQFEFAIESYDRAISLNPNIADIHFNRGAVFHCLNLLVAAIECYDKAIALNPNHVNALWNKTLALLLNGDLASGFQLFELGAELKTRQVQQDFSEPLWLGKESLEGKTILLHNEQGLGDTLQFCRYAKLVSNLGGSVILKAQPPLISLLNNLEGVSYLVPEGEHVPKFDYQCPLMSLPLAFKTDINSIPASKSYIKCSPDKILQWAEKLGEKLKLRIGIAWSSTSDFAHDANRSLSLAELLLALPPNNFEYICLQKVIKESDQETLKSNPQIKFFGEELHDFSDTAALIENLDLVITTCTSIPHLSGALGKETWLLLSFTPDWRWLLEREDSPWYPTAKLYRQDKIGDWGDALERVKVDLEKLHLFK